MKTPRGGKRERKKEAIIRESPDLALHIGKQEFENVIETRLAELRRSLDAMKATAELSPLESRVEIVRQNAELESQLEVAEQKFAKLRSTDNPSWRDLKFEVELAIDDLESSFESATLQLG